MSATPKGLGYLMPAEWEKHDATWLSWPKDPNTFPPEILPKVEAAYVKMVDALSRGEEVRILVDDDRMKARVASMVGKGGKVKFIVLKTADVWMRDYAPTCVKGKDVALVKWRFNAWGNKYDDLLPDDEAGARLAALTGLRTFTPGLVLEGGSIDANGSGSLLTTEQCLLNPNRNPSLGRGEIEEALRGNLGVSNVIWLKDGIEGDDTDGHVDDIARFVGPRTVVVASEQDGADPNHEALKADRALLEAAKDEMGRDLEVAGVPMPPRVEAADGRLPASHLNFYIGNGAVVVPTFGGDSDRVALRTMEKAFPRRDVVGIDCRALVYGLGTLHCVTQQVPAP
ncbi:MAG TPA: agmatine deiminase family protein [Nitrososphaerales archaeon]|nr:agmatine deiminase family protein [Nitrososphaerales archaeon]